MASISATLLAYKEAENLRILLPDVKKQLEAIVDDFEIIVVDSKEPLDNTREICESNGARYINQHNDGFGDAFKTAIQNAKKSFFLTLDSDCSHNPIYIPKIYKKFFDDNCDVVIGSRYAKGGKNIDRKSSVIMSRILNLVFRVALGIKANDISTNYRLYNTNDLRAIELKSNSFDILQEVLLKLKIYKPNLIIEEVPITFTKRVYGKSKRKLAIFIMQYIKSLFKLTSLRVSTIFCNKK